MEKMNIYNTLAVAIFLILGVQECSSDREHKVHNIVLYPEKYSWCLTTPIQQIVGSSGYKPVTIDNNVCVGACYSYSIPKTQPAEPGELIGPYCDSCQPAKIECYHVNLHANEKNTEGPRTIQKRIQIIVDCACTTCDKIRVDDCDITNNNTSELPSKLFYQSNAYNETENEEPELLKMQKVVYDGMKNGHQLKHHHSKIINMFKSIDDNDNNGTFNEELNEIFDYKKVKEILDNNGKDEDDDDEEGIIGALNKHHYSIDIPQDTTVKPPETTSTLPHHHHHHKHHLGEVQQVGGTVEHLIKGPHGSMVLSPVEKLHIDSDALKANDEGVIISYENHVVKKNNHHIIVN